MLAGTFLVEISCVVQKSWSCIGKTFYFMLFLLVFWFQFIFGIHIIGVVSLVLKFIYFFIKLNVYR